MERIPKTKKKRIAIQEPSWILFVPIKRAHKVRRIRRKINP